MKKPRAEKNILIFLLLICLVLHVIFGLEGQRQIKKLESEMFLLEIRQGGLESRNAHLEMENHILGSLMREWREEKGIAKPQIKFYDIPLSEELQEYTYKLCKENEVDYELVLAIMDQESDYREEIISPTYDYGLMQINAVNHDWLRGVLSIDDFLDAKQNILAGVYILQGLVQKYENTHKVLMAYNMGEYGAQKNWNNGVLTSKYSRQVVEKMNELKTIETEVYIGG